MPYDNGYNAAGKNYLEQYDPDGDAARAAIWFYGGFNYSIDHNTFLHVYQNIKGCQGQQFQAQNMLIHHNFSDSQSSHVPGNQFWCRMRYDNYDLNAGGPYPEANTFGFSAPFAQPNSQAATLHTHPMRGGG